jgi:thiol-disulfide isomerase/thioredoxin
MWNLKISKEQGKKVWNSLKSWGFAVAIILVLRYTGLLSGISVAAGSLLLKTGAMDASPKPERVEKNFNYNFSLYNLDQKKIDMTEFKGKTIFLNLWATWCGPCRFEMPSIQKLYDKVDHDKIVFIMLSLDQKDPFNKVNKFVKDQGYTFPIYLPASSLPSQLDVPSIPTTFVISPEGKIVSKEVGAANYDNEEFKEFLEKL